MRRLAFALVLTLLPCLASAATMPEPGGSFSGHARMLPPGRRAPMHPHRGHDRPRIDPYGPISPSVVIDATALLAPALPPKVAARPAADFTPAQQQDQFGSWTTERP